MEEFVKHFLEKRLPLHILIINAGIAWTPLEHYSGIESQFYINFLSHFHLTTLLLPTLKESSPSRVVFTVSSAYASVPQQYELKELAYATNTTYNPQKAYAYSKLALMLFAESLNRRINPIEKVYINCIYPGEVATKLYDKAASFFKIMVKFTSQMVGSSPKEGCLNTLYAATCPDVEIFNFRSLYFIPVGQIQEPAGFHVGNKKRGEELWNFSESLVKKILNKS